MRQFLYVSDSLVGNDVHALDRLMVEARDNNTIAGLTGLLWTDGQRFAQVLEGDQAYIGELLAKLRLDQRHTNVRIVHDHLIGSRQFGEWSMARPANDRLSAMYEQRMRGQLAWLKTELSTAFDNIITGSRSIALGRL